MGRTGRGGRGGRGGAGTTFVGAEHAHDVGRIAAALELHEEFADGGFAAPPRPRRRRNRGRR